MNLIEEKFKINISIIFRNTNPHPLYCCNNFLPLPKLFSDPTSFIPFPLEVLITKFNFPFSPWFPFSFDLDLDFLITIISLELVAVVLEINKWLPCYVSCRLALLFILVLDRLLGEIFSLENYLRRRDFFFFLFFNYGFYLCCCCSMKP